MPLVEFTLATQQKGVVGDAVQYRIFNAVIATISLFMFLRSARILWFNNYLARGERKARTQDALSQANVTDANSSPEVARSRAQKSVRLVGLQHPVVRLWRGAFKIEAVEGVSIMATSLHANVLTGLRSGLYGFKAIRGVSVLGGSTSIARLHAVEVVFFLCFMVPIFVLRVVEVACGGWRKTPVPAYVVMAAMSVVISAITTVGFFLYGTISAHVASSCFVLALVLAGTRDLICNIPAIRAMQNIINSTRVKREMTSALRPTSPQQQQQQQKQEAERVNERTDVDRATHSLVTLKKAVLEIAVQISVVFTVFIVFGAVPYLRSSQSQWFFLFGMFAMSMGTVTVMAQDQEMVNAQRKRRQASVHPA